MKFKAKILNQDSFFKRLERKENAAIAGMNRSVEMSTLNIYNDAIRSIHAHLSKGETYGKHTASREGFPPNSDTGTLANSIQFEFDRSETEIVGYVGTNLKYGLNLEFGTSTIKPRPWLRPAFEKNKEKFYKSCEQAIKKALKK